MKVLWLCNMPMPEASEAFSLPKGTGGGWLFSEFRLLRSRGDIELAACFPLRHSKQMKKAEVNGATYYAVPRKIHSFFRYDASMEPYFRQIVDDFRPDIIHIHGTENTPAWAMMKACPECKYVVSLQGVISMIEKHVHAALPAKWQRSRTLNDLITGHSPKGFEKKYRMGAKYEQLVIQRADYLMGRTQWDLLCARQLGAKGEYVHAPRILRDVFYEKKWSPEQCVPHRIFSSTASSSIKGGHFLLEAVAMLKPRYPDISVTFTGSAPFGGSFKTRLRRSGYEVYMAKLIRKLGLQENVRYLGNLPAEKMADAMLQANLYVHPSSVDNSPNALAEAMMLGVPCVASYAGGIPSMLKDGEEGLLYQYDASYWLADHISRIFEDQELALKLSSNAAERARIDHRKTNSNITAELYLRIMDKTKL